MAAMLRLARGARGTLSVARAPCALRYQLLSQHMASSSAAARDTPTCLAAIAPLLESADHNILSIIGECRDLHKERSWELGFDGISAIAASPQRHLLAAQLVFLGALHEVQAAHAAPASAAPAPGPDAWECVRDHDLVSVTATATELLHLFMLVQDDVMDNASYRRGLTTVQRKLFMDMTTRGSQRHHNSCRAVANSQAIVMSDILHSKAQSLFADVCIKLAARGRPDVATQVNECFSQITEAAARYQHMDVTGWRAALSEATFDHFMDDFTKLGASLRFMFPLKLGTLIACGETSDVDTFSLHFGRAFHILNDLAALIGDPMTTGKDPLRNLEEGRPSHVVAAVYQLASADDRKVLERLLPGEAWHLGIPNPILSMFLKYDAAELLLSSVVAELDSAEAAIVESSREATLKRDGLENFHRGLRAHADHVTRTLRDWVSTWHAHPPIAYTS